MIVETDKYSVEFKKKNRQVIFKGTLRLQDKEQYRKIYELLVRAAKETIGFPLEIDMSDLQFLNSSGISSLSLFVIHMRKLDKEITIIGSESIPWQVKSLKNFQKLYNKVEITLC